MICTKNIGVSLKDVVSVFLMRQLVSLFVSINTSF